MPFFSNFSYGGDMSENKNRRFIIENLGCAKNQVDAEVLIANMEKDGWTYGESEEDASLIIVNTCGFIQTAKEESIQVSLDLKQKYPGKKVLLAGCFAQRYGESLKDSLPEVDGFFGNKALSQVGRAAEATMEGIRPVMLPLKEDPETAKIKAVKRKKILSYPGSAFVKISEGCNNNCSFCAIPLIRGTLQSRSITEVVQEIQELLNRGYREFNFVGQDLGSFGVDRGQVEFDELLARIGDLEGDFWIRLLYMHPDHFPMGVVDRVKQDPRILPYFDIPFQHASKNILSRMGRKGDAETYLDLIGNIRQELPQSVIRSTMLVGFPGETKRDFDILTDFQERAEIDWLGVFSYSKEEGTQAAGFQGDLTYKLQEKKRDKRKDQIMARQVAITEARMERFVGQEMKVLIEEAVEGEELYLGRTYLQAPDVDGLTVVDAENLNQGDLVPVRITKRNGLDLEARPL